MENTLWIVTAFIVMTTTLVPPAVAATCTDKSGNEKIALLELYTSQGCDSCPPADRWLLELPKHGYGSNRVVALAFHVDYWNYLGWVDPFARRIYTERQQTFARRTKAPTVYTPAFVLDGREYRWFRRDLATELQRLGSPRADISLNLDLSSSMLTIEASAATRDNTPGELYIALYENNLRTPIKAGENRGKTLEHAFVVRELLGPFTGDAAGKARIRQTITLATAWKTADLGVAAFVQEPKGTAILQALALDVCPTLQK